MVSGLCFSLLGRNYIRGKQPVFGRFASPFEKKVWYSFSTETAIRSAIGDFFCSQSVNRYCLRFFEPTTQEV
jgi:hypothetical protein